jgi:phytoene desaturase
VWFAKGGTNALVSALARLFTDLGGRLITSDAVRRIETAGGRVVGIVHADGTTEAFDAVASNADIVHTYAELLGGDPRGRAVGRALKRRRFSPSLFVVHFGLKRPQPELAHHTIVFGPRYRGLIDQIYRGPTLADDFSLYLHAPCVTDPSLAPEGCSTYYALSPTPHLGAAAVDWDAEGPAYADRILAHLEARVIPGLRDDLVVRRLFTPRDFERELNAWQGSAFSLEPVLTQSAWFRTHNRDDAIPNLYFVGAGTHPGAGVPGVIGSAKATAGLMIADLGGS